MAIAALACVTLFTGKMMLNRIGALEDKIAQQGKELGYRKGILGKADEFQAQYASFREETSQGQEPDERLSLLVSRLEKLAKEEGLILYDVRPLPSESEGANQLLKLALEMEGDIVNLARFLHHIVAGKDPVRIERYSFFQKVRMKTQINLNVELSFLYLE